MSLDEAALNIGRQIAKRVVTAWLEVRQEQSQRGRELVDLLAVGVVDRFHRRDLARQFERIGDEAARRLQPLYDVEYRDVPENERQAALDAVSDALGQTRLADEDLFKANANPIKLAMQIRSRVPTIPGRAGLSEGAGSLYQAILDETCVALVSIVRRLPEFQPRALAELLNRTSSIADDISAVLERLPRTSLDAPQGRQNDNEFRRRYLELVSTRLDKLELFGIDTHRYRPRTRVSVAYFSLTVTDDTRKARHSRPREDNWFEDRAGEDIGGVRVEEALADSRRTLLRGEAGSGKTTLLQWAAVNCARGGFTEKLAHWNGRVPFFVRLRSYGDRRPPRPEELPEGVADSITGLMPNGWVHRQLADNAVLLVDGVDELVSAQRAHVRDWLDQLATSYPELPIVVTSRPAAASKSWLAEQGFTSVLLEPMSPGDITEFCRRWHEAIRAATEHDPAALPCEADELSEYESALLRSLDARRTLRSLATNPLLCAMLCALNLDRRKQLPPDRMALYEASLEMLLERRDADRGLSSIQGVQLDKSAKLAILQHLAWRLTEAGRVELPFGDCVHHVRRAIEHMPDVDIDAESALRFLLERSGVIRDPVVGRVDFVHRTFQEYLAAKEAAEDHLMDVLIRRASSDRWRETIVMASGHATALNRTAIIGGILERAEKEPNAARQLRLLASACLETASTVDPSIVSRVDDALDEIVPPRTKRESRSLSLAGDRILSRLPTSLDGLPEGTAVACVRTAALVNGRVGLNLLTKYASDPRQKVQLELADVWIYFDAEEYARVVLADAPLTDGMLQVGRREHLPFVNRLANLSSLRVAITDSITDLSILSGLQKLTSCNLYPAKSLDDLSPLLEHPNLNSIWLQNEGVKGGFESLGLLPDLRNLYLSLSSDVQSIGFLEQIRELKCFWLTRMSGVENLDPILELQQLDTLGLLKSPIDAIPTVLKCPKLDDLTLHDATWTDGLTSLVPVVPNLRWLDISNTSSIDDLSPLVGASKLQWLSVNSTRVTDVHPLENLSKLHYIDLRDCPSELDLGPLANLTRRASILLLRQQKVKGLDRVRRHHIRRA